jgi:hypothetical protein
MLPYRAAAMAKDEERSLEKVARVTGQINEDGEESKA